MAHSATKLKLIMYNYAACLRLVYTTARFHGSLG